MSEHSLSLVRHPLRDSSFSIQTVEAAIQTAIQTVVIYGTDVQTVNQLGVRKTDPLTLHSLYVCTINHNGLYNGLYGGLYVSM